MDLAYTTTGGVVGAVVTNHLSRNQERRQLRAVVMQQLLRVAAVSEEVHGIAPDRRESPPRQSGRTGPSATARFGVTAVLHDGADAEQAQRIAVVDLVVAALSAGIPRRVLDFAGGGAERALQCEVIRAVDLRLGGVVGAQLDELMTQCEQYRQATAQLLLQALWHLWRTRLRLRWRLRALRQDAAALQHRQETAMSVLARPQYIDTLHERLRTRLTDQDPPRVHDPHSAA